MKLFKEFIITREVFLNLLIMLMWGHLLLSYFRGFIGMVPGIGNYQMEAQVVLVVCIIVAALPSVMNRMAVIDWLFLASCLCIYILNLGIFHKNYDFLIEKMFSTLCIVIPYFLMGRLLDIDKYLKPMLFISTLCIAISAFYFLIYMRDPAKMAERYAGEYYMHQSYRLLPHVMLLFWQTIKKFRLWKFTFSVLGMFLIIAYGTRGPLACLGVFCIIYFFFYANFRFALWIKGGIIGTVTLLSVFTQQILLFLQETLSSVNMSTRIIDRMLTGGLTHSTGRDYIKVKLYDILETTDSFWGFGLYSCEHFTWHYPHDYILDFFYTFGYTIGGLLMLIVAYIICKAHIVSNHRIEKEFILLLTCATVLKMFFSSTFIQEEFYFALIGFCTSILIRHHYNKQAICPLKCQAKNTLTT